MAILNKGRRDAVKEVLELLWITWRFGQDVSGLR